MTNKQFAVLDHNYLNTGGNCMVSIFAVYDRTAHGTRYVIANDEGFQYQTVDTIGHEPPADLTEEQVIIGEYSWDMLTCEPTYSMPQFTHEEFELYKYCQFEFYKKYCADFKTCISLTVNELPNELARTLTEDFLNWTKANDELVATNGSEVFLPDEYIKERDARIDNELQDIKNFKRYLLSLLEKQTDSEEIAEMLYDSYITIAVAGQSVKIPWGATAFNGVDELLDSVIEEW